ncbi:hypothetical protein B194_2502 [Serratia plymuthica A30]|nr:hypothetical protein B194_2502 [Serratia plymuthica A30]
MMTMHGLCQLRTFWGYFTRGGVRRRRNGKTCVYSKVIS